MSAKELETTGSMPLLEHTVREWLNGSRDRKGGNKVRDARAAAAVVVLQNQAVTPLQTATN